MFGPAKAIKRGLTSFAVAHTVNAGLGMAYTLIQTVIFSRSMPGPLFAQTIAATAIGLYTAPINQAVARANFVLLSRQSTETGAPRGAPEAAAAFYTSQILLLLVVLLAPLLIGAATVGQFIALCAYLFFCIASNVWFSEMQMAMMATGHGLTFERLSLVRRLIHFGLLGFLWLSKDFLTFALILALTTLIPHVLLMWIMREVGNLFSWPRGLTLAAARQHTERLWVSIQATFAEWLTLNGPYALFTAKFGIGPGLISLDAVMKLLRIIVTVTRNLSEIVLLRVSRAIFAGDGTAARKLVLIVVALAGGAAAALGLIVAFAEKSTFDALLGPNNTVPAGAGIPAAIALLGGVGFALGSHLVGHIGAQAAVRRIMWSATVAWAVFAAAMLWFPLSVLQAIWGLAVALVVVSGVAAIQLKRLLDGYSPNPE